MKISLKLCCILFFIINTGFSILGDIIIIDQADIDRSGSNEIELTIRSKYYKSLEICIYEILPRGKKRLFDECFILKTKRRVEIPHLKEYRDYLVVATDTNTGEEWGFRKKYGRWREVYHNRRP